MAHIVPFMLSPNPATGRVFAQVSLDSGDTSILVDGHAPAPTTSTTAAGNKGGSNKTDGAAPAAITHRAAVTASPKNVDVFLTAAHDGYLRKWSAGGCRLIAKLAVGATQAGALAGVEAAVAPGIGAVEWASNGSFAVCGLVTGDVVLVSPEGDMEVLSRFDMKPS